MFMIYENEYPNMGQRLVAKFMGQRLVAPGLSSRILLCLLLLYTIINIISYRNMATFWTTYSKLLLYGKLITVRI